MFACEEGVCDYVAGKYCSDGLWAGDSTDEYCSRCGSAPDPLHLCSCDPSSVTESNCADFLDDDCDALVDCADDDCDPNSPECLMPPCLDGTTRTCGSGLGLCTQQGEQTCSSGQWGACVGAIEPQSEICNSADDDCDGSTDEGCGSCLTGETRVCGSESGSCTGGLQECNAQGFWSICFGSSYVSPSLENCDGVDNDCDGEVDEGCSCQAGQTQACGSDVGECTAGSQICANGQWGSCAGAVNEFPEVCDDNKDNDCDSKVDDSDTDCQASDFLSPTCYDGVKNQNEGGVDCGGVCEPCNEVSCNDRKKNGDEDGIDCGGSRCPVCRDRGNVVEDESVCGDGECDSGEETDCPSDCEVVTDENGVDIFNLMFIIILILAVLGGGVWFYLKKKGGSFSPQAKQGQQNIKQQAQQQQPPYFNRQPVRQRFEKSLEERRLEESMKKSQEVFKRK